MTAAMMVAAAAVIAAGVAFAVVMVMMVALNIGIKAQITCQEVCDRCVGIAAAATVKLNTCLSQGHLCTATDAATDQNICIQCAQNTGQGTVTAATGVDHFGCHNGAVLHFVNLELLGVTEMLEDLTVSISNCNSHDLFTPFE